MEDLSPGLLIIALIINVVVCGIICGSLATRKGHSGVWFFAGLLGLLGILWVGFLPEPAQCPECGGFIPKGFRRCRHCGIGLAWEGAPLQDIVPEFQPWQDDAAETEHDRLCPKCKEVFPAGTAYCPKCAVPKIRQEP
jgi:hypothetical protein